MESEKELLEEALQQLFESGLYDNDPPYWHIWFNPQTFDLICSLLPRAGYKHVMSVEDALKKYGRLK